VAEDGDLNRYVNYQTEKVFIRLGIRNIVFASSVVPHKKTTHEKNY
jgi:hypothetical protein